MFRTGLVVHHTERTVVETVDAVGDTREVHLQASSARLERKQIAHPALRGKDGKPSVIDIVTRHIVAQVAQYYLAYDHQLPARCRQRSIGILSEIYDVYGRIHAAFGNSLVQQAAQVCRRVFFTDHMPVQEFRGLVEYVSEHQPVDLLRKFVIGTHLCDGIEIELERTLHITRECRRRELRTAVHI